MIKHTYERPVIAPINGKMGDKFGNSSTFKPVSHIDGAGVSALLEQYGSPLFVLSEKTIRHNFREAKRAFATRYPKVQFAWSYKTNYLNAVCKVFHQEGSWAEVVSRFEYDKAINNGIPGNKILFNGPDKSNDDLLVATENKSLIHIDHLEELYRLNEIADQTKIRPKVAIRVNMDTGIYPLWDRFGFNYENGQAWATINKIMAMDKLDLIGLHCHIGTFIMSTNAYAIAAGKMADLALGMKKQFGKTVSYLDLGGGFASQNTLKGAYLPGNDTVPRIAEYAEAITTTLLSAGFAPDELPWLYLETGRALIDDAGFLLGTVISNKRLTDGRRATIMDFGVNIMFTSFWYDHKISPVQAGSGHTEDCVMYGPLCMNIDKIRENVRLPLLSPGDQVVVHHVGAYNITQSMQFIALRPAVVMIDETGEPHLIKRREVLKTLEKDEICPDYLETVTV